MGLARPMAWKVVGVDDMRKPLIVRVGRLWRQGYSSTHRVSHGV